MGYQWSTQYCSGWHLEPVSVFRSLTPGNHSIAGVLAKEPDGEYLTACTATGCVGPAVHFEVRDPSSIEFFEQVLGIHTGHDSSFAVSESGDLKVVAYIVVAEGRGLYSCG